MSEKITNFEGVLYQHGEGTIEGGGFMRPTKQEEYENHWKDDLHAARGCYGWPLVVGCILSFSTVCGASYLLDRLF